MAEIESIDSVVAYQNKWMTVREHRIRRPSGAEGIFGVVEKPNCVVLLPIDRGEIHLVEQYRFPVGARFWEAPQGAWEERPDAPIEALAAGELREETGLVSHRLRCLGQVHLVPGYSNQACWVFLASELESAGETRLDQEEEGLISRAFPVETFEAMIASGEVKDSTTLCAYGLAKAKGAL